MKWSTVMAIVALGLGLIACGVPADADDGVWQPGSGQSELEQPKVTSERELVAELEELFEDFPWQHPHVHWLEIAKEVPGYGGHFYDGGVLKVYMRDPQAAEADEAVKEVLRARLDDPSRARGMSASTVAIEFIEAHYTMVQLLAWFYLTNFQQLLSSEGATMQGISQGSNQLVLGLEDQRYVGDVRKRLAEMDIPEDAVRIEVTGRICPAILPPPEGCA